jgi:hypothetical protein
VTVGSAVIYVVTETDFAPDHVVAMSSPTDMVLRLIRVVPGGATLCSPRPRCSPEPELTGPDPLAESQRSSRAYRVWRPNSLDRAILECKHSGLMESENITDMICYRMCLRISGMTVDIRTLKSEQIILPGNNRVESLLITPTMTER